MKKNTEVLSLLVDNTAGVLTRITSLFGRRGFNIDSLTVSATENPLISRITIVVQGDSEVLEQVLLQTAKLKTTRKVIVLDPSQSVLRELLLIKVHADETNRAVIHEIADIYKAKIIDLSVGSMTMELTGEPDKIDGFMEIMGQYEIVELCRTGITAMERGTDIRARISREQELKV